MSVNDQIFLIVFFVMVFVVPTVVVWLSYNDRFSLDLRDLWIHKDRVDKFAVIIMGTWWVHTSSMVMWTLLRSVQTQDYVTYMGWAIPLIARMYLGQQPSETKP